MKCEGCGKEANGLVNGLCLPCRLEEEEIDKEEKSFQPLKKQQRKPEIVWQ